MKHIYYDYEICSISLTTILHPPPTNTAPNEHKSRNTNAPETSYDGMHLLLKLPSDANLYFNYFYTSVNKRTIQRTTEH